MPDLTRDGDVFVLNIGDDENRFHPDWMSRVSELLDEVAAAESPRALITTASGKFFSNGLDLDWLGQNSDRIDDYVAQVHGLFAQVLGLGVPTVAALQGHTFAAGAMLALAHDWRVMRADRGFFCLPEADIRIPFTPGMDALIRTKLTPQAQTSTMVGALRFGGEDALRLGIVDATAGEDDLLATATGLVAGHAAKDGGTLGIIKSRMYADTLAILSDRDANRFGS